MAKCSGRLRPDQQPWRTCVSTRGSAAVIALNQQARRLRSSAVAVGRQGSAVAAAGAAIGVTRRGTSLIDCDGARSRTAICLFSTACAHEFKDIDKTTFYSNHNDASRSLSFKGTSHRSNFKFINSISRLLFLSFNFASPFLIRNFGFCFLSRKFNAQGRALSGGGTKRLFHLVNCRQSVGERASRW